MELQIWSHFLICEQMGHLVLLEPSFILRFYWNGYLYRCPVSLKSGSSDKLCSDEDEAGEPWGKKRLHQTSHLLIHIHSLNLPMELSRLILPFGRTFDILFHRIVLILDTFTTEYTETMDTS